MSIRGVIGSDVCTQFAACVRTAARAPGSTSKAAKAISKLRLTDEAWRGVVSDPLRRWRDVVRICTRRRRRAFFLDDGAAGAACVTAGRPVVRAGASSPTPVAQSPGLPQEQREQDPDQADREQDPADYVNVDRCAGMLVHCERENRAHGDQD